MTALAALVAGRAAPPAHAAEDGARPAAAPPAATWTADAAASGPVFLRQVVPGATAAAQGLARSRTIFLDRDGALVSPGPNDSQAGTSTLVARASAVRGWNPGAEDWAATMACMTELFARFDVVVTDVDPGPTPHISAVFGRAPTDLGMTELIGGVSPFAADCSVIERSIVFAFTDNLPRRPRVICEIMAQEIAHSYGLDHELAPADPMTYLSYAGDRAFQDRDAPCGESTARPCGLGSAPCRASQNSVALLTARLGASGRGATPTAPAGELAELGCRAGRSPSLGVVGALCAFIFVVGRRRRGRLSARSRRTR